MHGENDDADITPVLLGDGIVAYLGWGSSRVPTRNREALGHVAPPGGAAALEEAVLRAIAVSEAIEISVADIADPAASPEYELKLRQALPSLPDAAIDALASRWFFNALW